MYTLISCTDSSCDSKTAAYHRPIRTKEKRSTHNLQWDYRIWLPAFNYNHKSKKLLCRYGIDVKNECKYEYF